MNGQVRRGMNRKRSSHQILQIWQRKWRKYCAAALCVTLGMGSLAGAFPVQAKNDTYDFDLDRVDLYEALQKAVADGDIVDTDLSFQGANADEYDALLEAGGDLYELSPEMKKSENDLKLRVFARLEGDIDLENAYEVSGDESFIFLLVNGTDTEQRAVIHVDQLTTGEITIAPSSRVAADDGSLSAPSAGGAVSHGGSGGSGGGSSSGAAADETEAVGTEAGAETSASEETGAESTEQNGAGENTAPDENGAVSEDTAENQPETDQDTADGADSDNQTDSQTPDQGDSSFGSDSSEAAGDGSEENGAAEGDSTVEIEDDSQDEAQGSDASDSADAADDADTSDSGDTADSADTSDSGDTADSADTSDSGDAADSADSDEGTPVAGISLHAFHLLAATPSEAERIDSVVTVPATPSEASPSEADKNLIPGVLHEAAVLNGKTAVAFETTAGDLELDDEALALLATPSEARRVYKASTDDVTVRVYADPEAFDEEVTLEVTKLSPDDPETADAYQEAMDKLEENGAVQDTMLLHDVTFYNEAGEEVEPAVPVSVTMEFLPGAFPEDADPATLSIHHMAEAEGNVTVENVADAADATDGKAEMLEDGKAVAEFSVDSFSVMASGVSARAGEDGYTWDDLGWGHGGTNSSLKFYVNLDSNIANSEGGSSGTAVTENFTGSVYETTVVDYPRVTGWGQKAFYAIQEEAGTSTGYIILQSQDADSAYEVDQTIRNVLYSNSGYNEANTPNARGSFRIKDMPSDQEILASIRNNWPITQGKPVNGRGNYYRIQVGNIYFFESTSDYPRDATNAEKANFRTKADLTEDTFAIRWYVFKYNNSDQWHIDGILVPKTGELTVQKTFSFDPETEQQAGLEAAKKDFYIKVEGDTSLSGAYYKLVLERKATDDPNTTLTGTRESETETQAVYQWHVPVMDADYTITETENLTGWKLTNATYEYYPSEGESVTGTIPGDGFSIKCVKTAEDEGEKAQRLELSNVYEKNVQDLTIQKAVEGIAESDIGELNNKEFQFTITAVPLDESESMSIVLKDGDEYTVEGSNTPLTVADNRLTVTATVGTAGSLENVASVTIKNLPEGKYTVSEAEPSDLNSYYWASSDAASKSSVSLSNGVSGEVIVTNTYHPYYTVKVRKRIDGKMGDKGATFNFAAKKDNTSLGNYELGDYETVDNNSSSKEWTISDLKAGETIAVQEVDSKGYEVTASCDRNDVEGAFDEKTNTFKFTIPKNTSNNEITVEFTNTKDIKSPTGVITNVLPYAAMLAIGALGVTGFTLKGRRKDDND